MSRKVATVVVTFNRLALLKECLQALMQQEASTDIIVVNNNSNDGTKEYLDEMSAEDNDITCIHLEDNFGGAGGFYWGIKYAMEHAYDYIWIMDDDTIPERHALAELMKHTGQEFGFLSSNVLWTDGTPCKMNQQHFVDEKLGRVDQASFVSLLFPREAVAKCGLPIKEYFIWGDDKEYTLRLSNHYPCYFVKDSVVIHKMGNNAGSNIKLDNVERIGRYFYAYRNDFFTARRRGIKDMLIYFAAFFLNIFRIIFSSTDHKGKRIGVMFSGMKAGLSFTPEIKFAKELL